MVIRSGLALNGDPWIEDFTRNKASYKLTSECKQSITFFMYLLISQKMEEMLSKLRFN